jgi:hypothetical protein
VPNTRDETVKQNHPATGSSIRDQGANTCLCYRHFIKYLFIHEKRNQRLVPSLASILASPLGGGLRDWAREDEEEKKKLVSARVLIYIFNSKNKKQETESERNKQKRRGRRGARGAAKTSGRL